MKQMKKKWNPAYFLIMLILLLSMTRALADTSRHVTTGGNIVFYDERIEESEESDSNRTPEVDEPKKDKLPQTGEGEISKVHLIIGFFILITVCLLFHIEKRRGEVK